MAHPYKDAAHKNDPKWVKNLNKYVISATDKDVKAMVRNNDGDEAIIRKAAYVPPMKGTGQ